jgi:hypothetical protein
MRVYLWVFILIAFVGSGLSSLGSELIAQNSNPNPASINREYNNSEQDSLVCSDDEIKALNSVENEPGKSSKTEINACRADFKVETEAIGTSESTAKSEGTVNEDGEQISLLPNPEVEFVDEYMVKFDSFRSRDTIFYGGLLPFVAIPDSELANEDRFFNEESFSVFLYFKRKF